MIYMVGDKCLQYAKCGVVSGQCQVLESPEFISCKTCVQKCIDNNIGDSMQALECENKCP
jgi:hypothetical protein